MYIFFYFFLFFYIFLFLFNLSYKLRLNQFGDMSGDEFRRYVHGKDGTCFKSNELINRNGIDT